MHNLTEVDQLIVICVIAGFIGGVLSGVIDDLSKLLIKDEKANIKNIVSKSFVSGLVMGVILSSINFAFACLTSISTQELIRTAIITSVGFAFSPILVNLFGLIPLKLFSESQD